MWGPGGGGRMFGAASSPAPVSRHTHTCHSARYTNIACNISPDKYYVDIMKLPSLYDLTRLKLALELRQDLSVWTLEGLLGEREALMEELQNISTSGASEKEPSSRFRYKRWQVRNALRARLLEVNAELHRRTLG